MKTNQLQKNIPTGWQQVRLGDICDFKKGKGLPKDDLINDGKYEAIHYGELFTKYHEKIESILSRTNNNKDMFLSKKNDILMPTSDVTPRGLSTASFIDKDGVILGGDILVIRPKSNILNGLFFSNFVSSQKKEVIKLVSGTTVFHLYGSDMAKLHFNLPPLLEQGRIVSILEVWDKSIEKLTQKIEVKKQIKKGLMQNLLTGKKRLSGFTDKWKSVNLGETCKYIKTGKLDANAMVENGKYRFYTCAKDYYFIDDYAFDTEALLVSGNGANVGYVHYYKGKFNAYQRTYVLYDFTENILFIKYLLDLFLKNRIKEEVREGNTPYITMDTLTEMNLKVPTVQEQQVIVNILDTADKEITELEKKLSIIKEQKRYLLNNLITGTIRTPETLSTKVTQ
jgi:type I restriction enzyme S subunit